MANESITASNLSTHSNGIRGLATEADTTITAAAKNIDTIGKSWKGESAHSFQSNYSNLGYYLKNFTSYLTKVGNSMDTIIANIKIVDSTPSNDTSSI